MLVADFQIHVLDLRFQGAAEAIAAFLVIGPGGPVLIECGPGSTLEALRRELARYSLTPQDIGDVLVTHIHLDHAGAAGWWAQQGARIHVHHVGAPHLIDPSKLLASAERIYGAMMKPLWGDYLASPAAQVRALHDGDIVEAGGLQFRAHDTPGHARHHMVYQLGGFAFAGDLAGIRLNGRAHTRLPTPPPEFEREAWLTSLGRIRDLRFKRLYLTHFGVVDDVETHWAAVARLLEDYAERVRTEVERGTDRDAIVARFTEQEEARQRGDGLSETDQALYAGVGPLGMSVDGLLRYWKKQQTA
jgi:glyoxylase-like metal-dependent hydrolase (beta-lactamase superfamily II)